MTERLLQYIWQFQYFSRQELKTVQGENIQVIFPGEWNHHQGPDFKQARIRIGETIWVGEVEIHVLASEWHKHRHSADTNYNKIILHVVWQNDETIPDSNGHPIPALSLHDRISQLLLSRYENWMQQLKEIPCSADITTVSNLKWYNWKERLLIERLQQKATHISSLLAETNNNWEEVFWRLLCRYFGAPVNTECFEQIATSVPLKTLGKHKNQLHQTEAFLLGQAGLLNTQFSGHYPILLQREYEFLKKKYGLQPITKPPAFLRMRPVNFPTIRLAQLAMLIHQSVHLFSKVKDAEHLKDIEDLFNVTANDFWNTHFNLIDESAWQPKKLGRQTIDTIIVNVVVPILFAYGNYTGDTAVADKIIRWLEEIPGEKNAVTKAFTDLQVTCKSSFDSQAFLQLRKNYCEAKRCLDCAIGNAILKRDE